MRYSDWTPLIETGTQAPTKAGLFQIRIREGLLNYPQGKSAMFYYGYATDLRAGLKRFREDVVPFLEVNAETLLARWMPAEDPEERFQQHLQTFLTNFGTMPLGNEMFLHKQAQEGHGDE